MATQKPPRPLTRAQKAKLASADYDVGFAKPPEETRFKAGESGNPSGRPKGKTTRTLIKEAFEQPVTVSIQGNPQAMPYRHAFVQMVMMNGLKGTSRDREYLFKLVTGLFPEEFEEPPKKEITPDRKAIMDRFKRRNGG